MAGRELPARARWMLPVAIVLLASAAYLRMGPRGPAPPPPPPRLQVRGDTMGTNYSVVIAGQHDAYRIRSLVERELADVDRRMSTYREDSELSVFNRAPAGGEPVLSAPLAEVFRLATDIGARSGGAFDVTVGPLVNAWGFGPEADGPEPSAGLLDALRKRTGQGAIRWEGPRLRKRQDDVVCDLSAVAKGYAVDRVADALSAAGIADYLVEVGGELRSRGQRPGGGAWRVGIERPEVGPREMLRVIKLYDTGVATSGDYRNFRVLDGTRRSHIIDPRTGIPVTHGLASVTVLHPRAAAADAWATALSVLGPGEGLRVASEQALAVLFVVRGEDGALASSLSPAMRQYLRRAGAPGTEGEKL